MADSTHATDGSCRCAAGEGEATSSDTCCPLNDEGTSTGDHAAASKDQSTNLGTGGGFQHQSVYFCSMAVKFPHLRTQEHNFYYMPRDKSHTPSGQSYTA